MGDTASVIKTLFIPALISLILFLLLTFVIVPIWRRYRSRYSQYLPIDSISEHTTSLRHRITNRIVRLAMPSTWRRDRDVIVADQRGGVGISTAGGLHALDVDLEDGEELDDIDELTAQILERHARVTSRPDNTRRLSRDLEEGFIDDSESDSDAH